MTAQHTPGIAVAGYEVTEEGRVFSSTNWRGLGCRELAQDLNDDGYPSVRLTLNGKRTRMAVHRLVAMAYLPDRPSEKHQIRHLDGDKMNSHAGNLAWGTAKQNADDREQHGRTSRGKAHSEFVKAGLEAANV
jgi:hypothetical protein